MVAHSDAGAEDLVLRGDIVEVLEGLELALGFWERERGCGADCFGDGLVDEVIEGADADEGEHLLDVALAGAEVSSGEGICGVEHVGIYSSDRSGREVE